MRRLTTTVALAATLAASACGSRASEAGGDGSADSGVDAAADSGHDDAGDSGHDDADDGGTVSCGDPDVRARLAACRAADDEASCEAAGGSWGTIGLSPDPECQCPTGQSGCPCTTSEHCISVCIAEPGPAGIFDCEGVTEGTCSPVGITVGCWCFFDDEGEVTALCVD